MPSADSRPTDSFYLSNRADRPPIVHRIPNPSTRTYKYIVADPSTKKCIIIYPKSAPIRLGHARQITTKRHSTSSTSVPTPPDSTPDAPDPILTCIAAHCYTVTHILETHSSPPSSPSASAAWSLRMHLLTTQGFPPSLCGGRTVASMRRNAARRYGGTYQLDTTLTEAFRDGQRLCVGRMRVLVLLLPGLEGKGDDGGAGVEERTGFLVGKNTFGGMGIADLKPEGADGRAKREGYAEGEESGDEERKKLWASLKKVLYLDEDAVVHAEHFGEEGDPPELMVEQCRVMSRYVDLVNEQDFVTRRRGEARMLMPENTRPVTKSKWALFNRRRN